MTSSHDIQLISRSFFVGMDSCAMGDHDEASWLRIIRLLSRSASH